MMADEPTLEVYIGWLKDADPDVRRNAAWTLGRQRDPRLVEPLINALHDDVADVRVRVVESLGNFKDERVVTALLDTLQSDADAEVRAYAAQSLARLPDAQAVEPLIAALDDDESLVRAAVAGALGAIHDPRAVGPLVSLLSGDADHDVRYYAAKSLSAIGGAVTVDALLAALKTATDTDVILRIVELLGQLVDSRAIEPLKALRDHHDEDIRETAQWALKQLG